MKGLVVKSTGSWYQVRDQNGVVYPCRIKGKFKLSDLRITNPVAVGDWVEVEFYTTSSNEGVISEIYPRTNYLIRSSVKHPDIGQILAANIDQAVLMVTLKQPRTSLGFVDRYLVSAETFRIPVVIIFNKSDLLNSKKLETVKSWADLYNSIGYQSLITSFFPPQGLDALTSLLQNKISLLSGHSGVGKSTLLNHLVPEYQQKTKEISSSLNKGVHTTTFAEMFEINPDSYLIDTPGIKELGLLEIGNEELSHYFPEMREVLGQCKYHNCIHHHEPGCAVRELVGSGIPESRYQSYLKILANWDSRR